MKTKEPKHYGIAVPTAHNTKEAYSINPESPLNGAYAKLTGGERLILQSILRYCGKGSNLIHIGGETLEVICKDTGYTHESIRNAVANIKKTHLIESTGLRGGYIVNPNYAIKGDCAGVWATYQTIENQLRKSNGNPYTARVLYVCETD